MSTSKHGGQPVGADRFPIKERDFQTPVAKRKKVVVQRPTTAVKKLDTNVKPGSLREEFMKALKVADRSERTISSYCDAVKRFQSFINRSPLNVTVNDIRAFFFI